jgi:hypothetical protein
MPAGLDSLGFPRTEAVRRALRSAGVGTALAADLLFLELWESRPPPEVAATLRASQIRRGNPYLAAEIRAEIRRGRPLTDPERAALAANA